jgi:hypothetical protein
LRRPTFPNGARFAFTIFDDTDEATVANCAPVYRLLAAHGLRTTKSIWVYPSRGRFAGESLLDPPYRDWILELAADGFEIGLHNVGDGSFTRAEILEGLERFREAFGTYPRTHSNHESNPDAMYWWDRRFEWPLSWIYRLFYRARYGHPPSGRGEDPASAHFWGDAFKQHIVYARNLTFNGVNTLHDDPRMPYRVRSKERFSNLWFSSSDGHTVEEMTDLLSTANVDALEAAGGACIVYTHFSSGFVGAGGSVDPRFEERIDYLARKAGWFVPVGTLLDHLASQTSTEDPGRRYLTARNVKWGIDRIQKRTRYQR